MIFIELLCILLVAFCLFGFFCYLMMPNKENFKKMRKFFENTAVVCGIIAIILIIICVVFENDHLNKISRDETQIFMESDKVLYERNFENRELLSLLIEEEEEKTTIRRVDDKVLLTVYLKDGSTEMFFVSKTLLKDTWWFEYHPELPDTDRIYIAK